MALKLEVSEKKRADVLAVNRDLLQSKLELERQLQAERKKLASVMESGKVSTLLKEKVAEMEGLVRAGIEREKEGKTRERVLQRKVEELVGEREMARKEVKEVTMSMGREIRENRD